MGYFKQLDKLFFQGTPYSFPGNDYRLFRERAPGKKDLSTDSFGVPQARRSTTRARKSRAK